MPKIIVLPHDLCPDGDVLEAESAIASEATACSESINLKLNLEIFLANTEIRFEVTKALIK